MLPFNNKQYGLSRQKFYLFDFKLLKPCFTGFSIEECLKIVYNGTVPKNKTSNAFECIQNLFNTQGI